MNITNISSARFYPASIESRSSEINDSLSAQRLLDEYGYWSSLPREASINEYVVLDYGGIITADYIMVKALQNRKKTFPSSFRIELSNDASNWRVLVSEWDYDLDGEIYELNFDLTGFRYLRFVATSSARTEKGYLVEIASIKTGISGVSDIECSSKEGDFSSRNLVTESNQELWKSEPSKESRREWVVYDLGQIYTINRIVLESGSKGFPEHFSIQVSVEEDIWDTIHDEKNFKADHHQKYFWELGLVKARYVRFEGDAVKFMENRFQAVIASMTVYGAPRNVLHSHNIGELTMHASVFQAGMVRLARDGEDSLGAAVQGNDRRLRDASEIFKGIMRFSSDNESEPFTAVQSSDNRLKPATSENMGIARFAYDRETKPLTAVQGNDSRLKIATTESFGIVRVCPNGEYQENGVVRGDDMRLQKASSATYGIVRVAHNGESSPNAVVSSSDTRLQSADVASYGIVQLALDGEVTEGKVVQANDQRLKKASTIASGIVELAENGEQTDGRVVQASDSRLKDATTENKGIVELAEDGEIKQGIAVQASDSRLKDATTENKGIVELAEDGENRSGVVVQGNDRRLRDADVTAKGIVRMASDGEVSDDAVVISSDKRLRDATILTKGIARLAHDGEKEEGAVVQASDSRLKDATTENKGIVELAEDGEVKPGAVVQSNDSRLREATGETYGLVKLGENGESSSGVVVQGDDKRLREGTTRYKGIVELAEDGEDSSQVVVQGNDSRLQPATTHGKGIVELAEDGEDIPGVVVQGNDSRLRRGTTDYEGIIQFARSGEERGARAVQSDDPRLKDAREPLPHTHDYSPRIHNYSDHRGTISINESKSEPFTDITPPPGDSAVIYGRNSAQSKGTIGVAGVVRDTDTPSSCGVLGHGNSVGVRGQAGGSNNAGAGVMGLGRFAFGGLFTSEHNYAVVADGRGKETHSVDSSVNLKGSGKGLLVHGETSLNGTVHLKSQGNGPASMVEMFQVEESEYLSPGDIVTVSSQGGSILTKSKQSYDRSVIGIITHNAVMTIDNTGAKERIYPIALSGKVSCKVDAREKSIKPGDLIVTSDTPGCGKAGIMDSMDKMGTVIGKALDGLDDGLGTIPVFIFHQ